MTDEAWKFFAVGTTEYGIKRAKERYKQAMTSETILDAARVLHERCDMWADVSQHRANQAHPCGPNADSHVEYLAGHPYLVELWDQHHQQLPGL